MSPNEGRWALVVNGGAKEIKPEEAAANRSGCREAAAAGRDVLERGGSAVDAVETAIAVLERLPVFNAGYGSSLRQGNQVEMCAAIMDGNDLSVGAVGALMGVRHPIRVARLMLPQEAILLAGEGAFIFARENHAELCDPEDLIVPGKAEAHDTVGAVALDLNGNLAAGTSTGGLTGAAIGRMGDSALPGCGFYAENGSGAVALSGEGESIARLTLASQIMARLGTVEPDEAIRQPLQRLPRLGGDGGAIALDPRGRIGWWHNSPNFAVAAASSGERGIRVWLAKGEETDVDE